MIVIAIFVKNTECFIVKLIYPIVLLTGYVYIVISEKNKNNERIFKGIQVAGPLSCIYLLFKTLSKLKANGFHSEYEFVTLLLPFVCYILSVIEQKKLNRLQIIKKMIDNSLTKYNSEN